jgi:hypothetical protein
LSLLPPHVDRPARDHIYHVTCTYVESESIQLTLRGENSEDCITLAIQRELRARELRLWLMLVHYTRLS